jgi:hypothetical protein
MTDGNVARVNRYHEALNALDLPAVESMLAADAEYHSPSVGALVGRPAIMAAMRSYFDEYPDQLAIDDVVEALDSTRVRSQWRLKATSRSTGDRYERSGSEVISFSASGLIIRVEVEDR